MTSKIIVAYDKNRAIGYQGTLPWKVPGDMAHFKATTLGNVVVMGYNTYASLKMPLLPRRDNIVITTKPTERLEQFQSEYPTSVAGPIFVDSLASALAKADKLYPDKMCFIIGGASIYKQSLTLTSVEEIIVSHIDGEYPGDVYFPKIGHEWRCSNSIPNEGFSIATYHKENLFNMPV